MYLVPSHIYSNWKKNYNSWIKSGFKNYFFKPNNRVHRILTKEAFLNLCHPFQPFALGQNNFAIKVAIKKYKTYNLWRWIV